MLMIVFKDRNLYSIQCSCCNCLLQFINAFSGAWDYIFGLSCIQKCYSVLILCVLLSHFKCVQFLTMNLCCKILCLGYFICQLQVLNIFVVLYDSIITRCNNFYSMCINLLSQLSFLTFKIQYKSSKCAAGN